MKQIHLTIKGSDVLLSSNTAGVTGENNATDLFIAFGDEWAGCEKSVTFFDATVGNPVKRLLTDEFKVSDNEYICPIPAEPLVYGGECLVVIDGYEGERRIRTKKLFLEVDYAPGTEGAGDPGEITPSIVEQLQAQVATAISTANKASEDAASAGEDVATVKGTADLAFAAAARAELDAMNKAPLVHTHEIANVEGLQVALSGKAAASHTHAISNITGLQTALDGKAASNHNHSKDTLVIASANYGSTLPTTGLTVGRIFFKKV